jgi:hypothetical protein
LLLENDWISWPEVDERLEMEEMMIDKLPKCMGFIDGSHIPLDEAPSTDPESYFTRKQRYAIQIQAICDMERRIRNIKVGFPGSVHDARVFANSSFGRNPGHFLSDGQWVAADSAYAVSPFLVTPFRNNAAVGNQRQRREFNKYFSGFRVNIECCFGILKETFASLKGLRIRVGHEGGHQLACEWITACCILYNIILESLEDVHFDPEEDDEDQIDLANDPNAAVNEERRLALFRWVTLKLAY